MSSPAKGMAGIITVPCIHAPFTNKAAFTKVLDRVADAAKKGWLTHLAVLGDWVDASPASAYPNEEAHDQEDEYEAACLQARQLRAAAGRNVVLIRHDGNHEDRLEPHSLNVPKRLRRRTHWTRHNGLRKEWGHWTWVPYVKGRGGCTQIGQVILYHGYDLNSNSDELEGLQMAYACGGHAFRLTVRAHTHRPLPVT